MGMTRTRTLKTLTVSLAAMAALALASASAAWACSVLSIPSDGSSFTVTPGSGTSGSEVTVRATKAPPGPVEIRWNGINGTVLARPSGPDFSVVVIVPKANPDSYSIVAMIPGNRYWSAPFQVTYATSPSGSTQEPTETTDGSPASGSASGATSGASTSGGSTGSGSTSGSSSGGETAGTTSGTASSGGGSAPASGTAATGGQAPSGAGDTITNASPATATPAVAGASPAPGRTGPANASAPRATSAAATDATPSPAPAGGNSQEETATLSARSVTSDLWSGMSASPSRTRLGPIEAPSASSPDGLALAIGLLVAGAVALMSGITVLEVRYRRRVRVGASAPPTSL